MKFLITSDLHQWIPKWDALVSAVEIERPRFVLIAGDLLPKAATFSQQKAFFSVMRKRLLRMRESGPVTIITYLGNDDPHVLEPLLDELQDEGLCVNLNGQVYREEGLIFCGMNKVRDYPFGYKHWCVPDGDFLACSEQFCGEGLTLDEDGNYMRLDNLKAYLSKKPSIAEELDKLKAELKPGEMERSVWMIHQPPTGLGMDVLTDGRQVGSPTISDFILRNQPLLGCSGHIHESPYQPGGKWVAPLGRTVWFQPGQMNRGLHFVTFDLRGGGSVDFIGHSIFGRESRTAR